MNYLIRRRQKNDCKDIAKIVTISWNETYKGIVPDWFLEYLYENEEERAIKAYNEFDEDHNHQFVLEINDEIVGFINCGASLDEDYPNCGEIFALYILKKHHKKGLGKKLVEVAKKELKNLGFNQMIICCLKGNQSNDFYKHIGGVYVKDGLYKRLNLKENIYFYDKI